MVRKCQLPFPSLHSQIGAVTLIMRESSQRFTVMASFGSVPVLDMPVAFFADFKEPGRAQQMKSYFASHFFCQSYCGSRLPSALTAISSASRLARVSGRFALAIQPNALLR